MGSPPFVGDAPAGDIPDHPPLAAIRQDLLTIFFSDFFEEQARTDQVAGT